MISIACFKTSRTVYIILYMHTLTVDDQIKPTYKVISEFETKLATQQQFRGSFSSDTRFPCCTTNSRFRSPDSALCPEIFANGTWNLRKEHYTGQLEQKRRGNVGGLRLNWRGGKGCRDPPKV